EPFDKGKLSYNQIDPIFCSTMFSRREQQVLSQILDWASQINAEEHARLGGCVFNAMTEAEINRLIEATFASKANDADSPDANADKATDNDAAEESDGESEAAANLI